MTIGKWRAVPLANHVRLAVILAMAVCAVGCGRRHFANVDDGLRKQNMALSRHVRQLEKQIERQVQELEHFQQQLAKKTVIEGAEPPRFTLVRFGRYSGAIDTDRDGKDDLIRFYVRLLDQKGRFMPLGGRAVIQTVEVAPGQPAQTLGERIYEPDEFDAAYRSGMTGTHYTLELPLPSPMPEDLKQVSVTVFVYDAATGAMHSQEQVVNVKTGHQGSAS